MNREFFTLTFFLVSVFISKAQVLPVCFKGLNPTSSPSVGTTAKAECVADFNGDGNIDLVVANWTSNNVSVLLGNGNGTFAPKVNYGVGSQPTDIISSDFNSDGKADLAVVNNISDNISVLIGNGNGSFSSAVT